MTNRPFSSACNAGQVACALMSLQGLGFAGREGEIGDMAPDKPMAMKILLTLSSLVSIGVALWAGWNGLHGVLVIGFLAFALLLFIANVDRISELMVTPSGIKARTREVLHRAENTVSELQSLARIVSEATLSLVKRSGRMGGYDDDEAERIKESVLNVLAQIGVPDSEQDGVLKDWHRLTEFDYVAYTLGHTRIPEGFQDNAILQEWKALRSLKSVPTPQQLRAFLDKWGLLAAEREEYVKDYEFYLANRTHRRPEVWKARESWGHLRKP